MSITDPAKAPPWPGKTCKNPECGITYWPTHGKRPHPYGSTHYANAKYCCVPCSATHQAVRNLGQARCVRYVPLEDEIQRKCVWLKARNILAMRTGDEEPSDEAVHAVAEQIGEYEVV